MGTALAVINFDDSMVEMLRVLAELGNIPGSNSSIVIKETKLKFTKWTGKELLKHQRKQLWAIRKGFGDRDVGKEGKTYRAGELWLFSWIYHSIFPHIILQIYWSGICLGHSLPIFLWL